MEHNFQFLLNKRIICPGGQDTLVYYIFETRLLNCVIVEACEKNRFFISGSYLRLKKATNCHLNQPGRTGEH